MLHAFIPKRFAAAATAFYMSGMMACVMSFTIVALNTGFADGFISRFWHAYLTAMPLSFCWALCIRPLAGRLAARTVKQD